MAAAFSIWDPNIRINFWFEGSNTFKGGIEHGGSAALVVDLIIKDFRAKINMKIPKDIKAIDEPKQLIVTCIKNRVKTHPDPLGLSVEQIKNLAVRIGIFTKGEPDEVDAKTGNVPKQPVLIRNDVKVPLTLPESFELYQRYRLVISSKDFKFTARMEKEEAIAVADLTRLSKEELKKRFETAFLKGIEYDSEQATIKNDPPAFNEAIDREQKNIQLLISIAEALQKKGREPQ